MTNIPQDQAGNVAQVLLGAIGERLQRFSVPYSIRVWRRTGRRNFNSDH
jgi:hypothetical protein